MAADAKEEEPEERECRICRGDAEPGNPLYVPCDCRGSIRYCHEECLVRWLDHSGKDRCELCGVEFAFAPVYAEGAPDRLPMSQLIGAGLQYIYSSLLPLVLRICASTLLWLGVAPLATCMLYRAWIHRPSELPVAWSGARLLEELASGLVVVAAIVVSFLSLLSFTDYMRVRWEIADLQRNLEDDVVENEPAPQEPVVEAPPPLMDEEDDEDDEVELHVAVDELLGLRGPLVNVARNVSWLVVFNAAYLGVFAFAPFAVGRAVSRGASRVLGQPTDADVVNVTQVDPARAWASQVVRFVASGFNATANGALPNTGSGRRIERLQNWSRNLGNFADKLAARSTSAVPPPATLRLGDLGRVALGYAALGLVACLGRELFRSAPAALRAQLPVRALRRAERALDAAAAAAKVSMVLALKMVVLPTVLGAGLEIAIKPDLAQVRALGGGAAGAALARWVLGITFMLVVTVRRGVVSRRSAVLRRLHAIDARRLLERRSWVVSYLILRPFGPRDGVRVTSHVTSHHAQVAVLQLREQLHPAVLGQWVRPHEPRPDLLAALLAEPAQQHARRLLTSLLIYAGLLFVLVAAPVHLLAPLVEDYGPLNLKVSYAAPAAQIPLELLCFHLALLTLLERLKKRIGDGQRFYLTQLCQKLHLQNYLLPDDGPELDEATLDAHNAFDAAAAAAGRQRAPPERWAWGDERPSLREVRLRPRAPRPSSSRLVLFSLVSWAGCVLACTTIALLPLLLGRLALRLLRCDPGHDPASLAAGWALALFALGPWLEGRRRHVEPSPNDASVRENVLSGVAFVLLWFLVLPFGTGLLYDILVCAYDGAYGYDFLLGTIALQITVTARARCAAHAIEQGNDIDRWSRDCLQARSQLIASWSERSFAPVDCRILLRLSLYALGALVALATAPVSILIYTARIDSGERFDASVFFVLFWSTAASAITRDMIPLDASSPLATYRAFVAAGLGAAAAARGLWPLKRWLDAAHGAARDARYLVGLRLQNHVAK